MNIRKINDTDVEGVSLLMMRNFDEMLKKHHSDEIIEKFEDHSTAEKLRQQMFWKDILVVEENNEIVATGAVANFGDQENPKYSISNFFVKPELHRRGIGKALFIELKKLQLKKVQRFSMFQAVEMPSDFIVLWDLKWMKINRIQMMK